MLRTGSICASFIYNYMTTSITDNDTDENKEYQKRKKAVKCLSDVFANCGGILTKVSQILSIDSFDEKSFVFSDCKPFNSQQTIDYLTHEIQNNEEFSDICDYDLIPYKCGSIGQVHKAKYKDTDIILKVRYYNLKEQAIADLNIIDNLAKFLYANSKLSNGIKDVKQIILEEFDYENEIKNHKIFYNIWKDHETIKIADVIEEISTDSIIAMNYIQGETLSTFIEKSTSEDRLFFAQHIFEFIFVSLFHHNVFYNDIHFGNFLINDDNKLYVMDFGSINFISTELLYNFKELMLSLKNKDDEMVIIILQEMGIINDNNDEMFYKQTIHRFNELLEPFLCDEDFDFNRSWYHKLTEYASIADEWELPENLVYFTKIPFALFPLFVKMEIKTNFSKMFFDILDKLN